MQRQRSKSDIGLEPGLLESHPDSKNDGSSTGGFKLVVRGAVVALVVVLGPLYCRHGGLQAPARCGVILASVLVLNIVEVMPLYCTSLFIPVLGSLCAVLGAERDLVETSTLLVGNFFNNTSFLVLGALVLNAIFSKCGLEKMFMEKLFQKHALDSPSFLLYLMMGSMAMCSVLYSGSIMLLAAVKPLVDSSPPPLAKRVLLGIAFASNAGSTWLPISSPVNLIAVAMLGEFDTTIEFWEWPLVSVPVSTLVLLGSWLCLLKCIPDEAHAVSQPHLAQASPVTIPQDSLRSLQSEPVEPLDATHKFFLAVAVVAVLAITVFADLLQPIVGHPACISLCVVVLVFGSGFMSRQEFVQLDWDLLALVGGTNVMAFLVRETGLGAELSAKIVGQSMFTSLPFWGMLVILVCGTLVVSTCVGHSLTGVLLLPLMVAIGVKLQAAETTTLLIAIAIPLGMGMVSSSFDNMAAYTTSQSSIHRRDNNELKQRDFVMTGGLTAIFGAVVVLIIGFGTCFVLFGRPPPVIVSETGTPKDLKPKVVTENIPHEANHVTWNEGMPDWKAFIDRPDKKAFAVSELEPGMASRAWAASWNHLEQQDANRAAILDCESVARNCYVIYPRKSFGMGHPSHDPRLKDKDQGSDTPGGDNDDSVEGNGSRADGAEEAALFAQVAWPSVADAVEEALWLLAPSKGISPARPIAGSEEISQRHEEDKKRLAPSTSLIESKALPSRRMRRGKPHVGFGQASS